MAPMAIDTQMAQAPQWRESTIDETQAALHPQVADAVAHIERLRQSIDNVDAAIVLLLSERFKYTEQVGQWKAQAGFGPSDSKREAEQVERLHQVAASAGLPAAVAEQYHRFVVTAAKNRHQQIAQGAA